MRSRESAAARRRIAPLRCRALNAHFCLALLRALVPYLTQLISAVRSSRAGTRCAASRSFATFPLAARGGARAFWRAGWNEKKNWQHRGMAVVVVAWRRMASASIYQRNNQQYNKNSFENGNEKQHQQQISTESGISFSRMQPQAHQSWADGEKLRENLKEREEMKIEIMRKQWRSYQRKTKSNDLLGVSKKAKSKKAISERKYSYLNSSKMKWRRHAYN